MVGVLLLVLVLMLFLLLLLLLLLLVMVVLMLCCNYRWLTLASYVNRTADGALRRGL